MASIPGAQFNITGATGSTTFLSAKDGWFCYVFPRGAFASADSTGTQISLDSSATAGRFSNNKWIQVGLDTSKIRKITLVNLGTGRLILNSAVTVAKNDRIFHIGSTQPSVVGGSATYIAPASTIWQRDDDASDLYANSKVTSNANGLVQFFANPALYDCILQDGNQANQGYIADLPVGAVEGVSTSTVSLFGATATFNAAFGVTGWATFGASVTMNAALGVTGAAAFGSTVTLNSTLGVTGSAVFGSTVSLTGTSGNYSHSGTVTFGGVAGFSSPVVFGQTATFSGPLVSGVTATFTGGLVDSGPRLHVKRLSFSQGTLHGSTAYVLSAGWGSSATIATDFNVDSAFSFLVGASGAGITDNPTVTVTFIDSTYPYNSTVPVATRFSLLGVGTAQPTIPFIPRLSLGGTNVVLTFFGLPVTGETYGCAVALFGSGG